MAAVDESSRQSKEVLLKPPSVYKLMIDQPQSHSQQKVCAIPMPVKVR
jgi:hypothetical protein